MTTHLAAWALLAWLAMGLARTLLPAASAVDAERREAPRRSGRYYGLVFVSAVLDASGSVCIAVAIYAALGFAFTAMKGFTQ
jgi:hypothetical protein